MPAPHGGPCPSQPRGPGRSGPCTLGEVEGAWPGCLPALSPRGRMQSRSLLYQGEGCQQPSGRCRIGGAWGLVLTGLHGIFHSGPSLWP